MIIKFKVQTNYPELYLNTARFILKNGTEIEVDRTATGYTPDIKADEPFQMEWHNCYLWSLNGYNIFGTGNNDGFHLLNKCYEAEFEKMLKCEEASVDFWYEDEAPGDYDCKVISWEIV